MGWRGDYREYATSAAYSMETLMPIQFLLPSIKYVPLLANSIGKYALHTLVNFQLFFAKGSKRIYETRPDFGHAVPYEKLEKEKDGNSPCACGDYLGHRSVYGGGYVLWMDAILRRTELDYVLALDLSITDWLSKKSLPTFLIYNPYNKDVSISFDIACQWQDMCPELFCENTLYNYDIYSLDNHSYLGKKLTGKVRLEIFKKSSRIIALIPANAEIKKNGWLFANGIPFDFSIE